MNRHACSLHAVWLAVAGYVLFSGLDAESSAGAEKITKEARETVEATKEYTAQQKEAFQQKANEELVTIQKQISALQGKAREVSAATRADLQASISELEKKKDAAKDKLNALRATTDEKWNAMKSGVDTALDEIKTSYRKVVSRLP